MPAPTITATENTTTDPNVRGSLTLSDGFTIESNDEDPAEIRSSLGLPQKKDKRDKDGKDEPEPPIAAEAKEEPQTRHRNPYKKVEFAVGKQREAERERDTEKARADALAKELEELKAKPAPTPTPSVARPPAPVAAPQVAPSQASAPTEHDYERIMKLPGAPDINTFQDLNAYYYAVNTFVGRQLLREERESTQRATQMQTLKARTDAEIGKRPDFHQKLQSLVIDTRVLPYLGSHPMGGDVIVYLADHPEEAQVLSSLHTGMEPQMNAAQAGKIGEIVGLLKAQAAAAPLASARPAISQASPVTKRVTGEPPAATDEPPDDDASEEQHEAYWGPRRRTLRSRRA